MSALHATDGDHAAFLSVANQVFLGIAERIRPASIRIIRIDNWFGSNWLDFSGKAIGGVGYWKARFTVPPFVPSRVEREEIWVKDGRTYLQSEQFQSLHIKIRSEENMRRYFDELCPETVAFWFSGQTSNNGRGSIMIYDTASCDEPRSWFVELVAECNWRPSQAHGITRKEFDHLTTLPQTIKAE